MDLNGRFERGEFYTVLSTDYTAGKLRLGESDGKGGYVLLAEASVPYPLCTVFHVGWRYSGAVFNYIERFCPVGGKDDSQTDLYYARR